MDMRVVTAMILLGLIVLIGISLWAYRRRRTDRLRSRFGREYERTVRDRAGRAGAEAELEARVERVETLHVRELDPKDRARLAEAWKSVQTQFAEPAPHASSAWIVSRGPYRAAGGLGVLAHRAKFENGEKRAVEADALLAEQDGTGRGKLHGQRGEGHHG